MLKKFCVPVSIALFGLAIACGGNKSNLVSPTAATPGATAAVPDQVTLKATAPTPVSPVNATIDSVTPTFIIQNATGKYVQASFSYRFQVLDAAGTVIRQSDLIPGGTTNRTSWGPIVQQLDANTAFTWRARAELNGQAGPWATAATFRTPDVASGYLRGNEVWDPLTDGKTVGDIIGPVTFIPGVGVRLDTNQSYIRYRLGSTLVQGEFSMVVTNVKTRDGDLEKSRIMSMCQGDDCEGDLTTNDRRCTIEKRGDGSVAWRLITSDDQIDTIGGERQVVELDPNQAYLWQITWNGFFRVMIRTSAGTGGSVYDFGKSYDGLYDPDPHRAFLGSPPNRSGALSQTVHLMIVRNVWISPNPRPAYANK